METLIDWDYQVFSLINGSGSAFIDVVMILLSDKVIWIPLYLWIIFKLTEQYEYRVLWVLVPIILAVTISDQVTSSFMKPFFERLRPCRDPLLADTVNIVSRCGGKYGFASSHAANTMALASLCWLYLRNRFGIALFGWAVLVGFSRIYLGVHFPGDVIVGALVGFLAATISYYLLKVCFPQKLRTT
ncbi:MAG: phosphatase PAP2 family protein [Cytophagales bacterium]|nr:phosphatase PAP2 family protein [Cytophagales bacterium]